MTQTAITNRREFDRFNFQDTFVVETENFQGISSTSSKNMSRKGAQLWSEKPLTTGSIVSVEVPSKKLQLMAEVRWVRPQTDGNGYEVGIAFHELFPSTGNKISTLIQEIQVESENGLEGPFFSFELEESVAKFLDKYVEAARPEPIVLAPVSYRRLGTPTENSYSFFTPTRPLNSEGTTTSFRIDQHQEVTRELPVRAILMSLLALSLLFFRGTFSASIAQLIAPKAPVAVIATTNSNLVIPSTSAQKADSEFVNFTDGPIEKIEWAGQADKLNIKISLRNEVTPSQVQISKMAFDDHPRTLIKVLNVDGTLEQKNIMVGHSLINQIRMGIHDENGTKSLHMVMDMTSQNVVVASSSQNGKTLNIRLEYLNNQNKSLN